MKAESPLLSASLAAAPLPNADMVSNMRIVDSSSSYETDTAFLVDLSAIRKRLIIGSTAPEWITQHTGVCPSALFVNERLNDGAIVVRIHRSQYLVIDGPDTERYDELFLSPHGRQGDVLVLDYECAEIAIGGEGVDSVVSELCPMPLQDLPSTAWCATRMAHADVVIRAIDEPRRHYRITVSPADARFFHEIVLAAVAEQGGRQIGYNNYWQEFHRGGPSE